MLVSGEPLVGKSSFLSLLAQKIAPDGWSVFEARGADLQADQIYIGQLEGRIRQVVDELAKARRTIWYIPDIVQLAMSGTHSGQSATILDQIIPAIAAGRLVVWAEASPKGMARLLRINPSLRGLFETVTIEPMSADDTLSLARGVMRQMEERANIRFEPDCAEVARDTVSHVMGSNALPGSVLLMLKLTVVRAEKKDDVISSRQILETLSQLSGLPLSILDTREQLDLAAVRDFFNARVIGQDEAVGAVVDRIAMLKAGLNDPGKPIGVFLFAGPTGTGKTELAKAVSEFLFGSAERMIRLDMSEFQTHESMQQDPRAERRSAFEADSLISRVRKQPFSVVLLDEFEKSHPMIWDLFLQVFDEGRLTDAMGQAADFRHCLIILTTNLGATAIAARGSASRRRRTSSPRNRCCARSARPIRPEFQNRLDKVIVFRPLTRELMRGILKKELASLLERRGLKDRDWAVEWESSALEFLLEKGFSPEMGARPLKRAIDQYVVAPLAATIVEKRFPEGDQFRVRAQRRQRHPGRVRRSRCGATGGRRGLRDGAERGGAVIARVGGAHARRVARRIPDAAGRIRRYRTHSACRRMDGTQRQPGRRHGVRGVLDASGSLWRAGAICPDGSGQVGDRNRECAARPAAALQPVAIALLDPAQRPFGVATVFDPGRHQGCVRRCADRTGADDRAGLRGRRRSARDFGLVPETEIDVPRLGRQAPHAGRGNTRAWEKTRTRRS